MNAGLKMREKKKKKERGKKKVLNPHCLAQ